MPSRATGADEKSVPIHHISGETSDVVDGNPEVTAYAWGGSHVQPDAPEALAKKSYDPATGLTRYWCKRATLGVEAGKLYNPQSPAFSPSTVSKSKYEYRKVSEQAFDLYLRFITTGNPLNLRNAERY